MSLKERESTYLIGGALLAISAVIIKKIIASDDHRPGFLAKKKHPSLKIPASLITEYKNSDGAQIMLRFDDSDRANTKLRFFGFDSKNTPIEFKDDKLKSAPGKPVYDSENIFYGDFTHSNGKVSLHDILAGKNIPVTDWLLVPRAYVNEQGADDYRYVCYDLESDSLTEYRINPSPPARRF